MTDLDRLLDFAARSRLPDGGFGYLGDDGRVLPDRPVETWIVARMTHVFGLAQLLGRPGADELVRHGVAALTDGPLHDAEHGGWRASTDDDTKAAYVHAFVVLAGSTATAAGADGGRGAAARRRWTSGRTGSGTTPRGWRSRSGTARWTTCSDYRGSTPTCTASRRRWPPRTPWPPTTGDRRPAARARRCAPPSAWCTAGRGEPTGGCPSTSPPLGAAARLQPRPARPTRSARTASRSGTSSSGRGWRCTSAPSRADPPDWLLDDAVALFDAAADRGWAADGADGFPYTLDWDDRPVVGARMHWVLCEAIAAATVLAEVTGEPRYRDLARRWRDHGEAVFADPATGSWHHELTPAGAVASGTWAGQPDAYHLAQMLLLDGRPVARQHRGRAALTRRWARRLRSVRPSPRRRPRLV